MEFLILGPIDVRNASGAVALGGLKPRAVLAVLLLRANEPVSAERLALALWGEDAPGGAVKTVQVHVSRLRKALGDPDVLTTTAAGYRLRVRPGELDAERFEALVESGRQALDEGRAEDAARILRDALALWRGAALAELALEPFAGTEIARLEEQRLAALELRAQADLAAGRHAEVVGELQRLVSEHPAREQLGEQLMLALYRCGRQTEALEAYAATRRVLVDQVGVEPGLALRELQQAILRHDPVLQLHPVEAEPPETVDEAATPLVGRGDELAWLRAHWERARAGEGLVVALTGARGIGKSRLAAEFARVVRGPGVAVLRTSGDGPADAILDMLRRASAPARPTLLVVDDADGVGPAVHAELARIAAQPTDADAGVLVVACAVDTRTLADTGAGDVLELGALDVEAVRAIAAGYAPGKPLADVPAEQLLQDSGGVARRVHELAGHWARREAARRVGTVAGRARASRTRLRSIQDELAGGVEELRAADERIARSGDETPVVCPYKGLASFDVGDAPYFFGRERLVAELVARLVGAPLLGIVGPSGSGKSSVLRAGLLPALAGGVLPSSQDWGQALMRPGEHPMHELEVALAGTGGAERVVIAVDQFEETFTACDDEQERAAFLAALGAAAADRDGRRAVAIALRADFYGRCAAYPELARPLAANHVLVGSMQRDELRRAIVRPAERAGLRVDPELADALVADVRDEPGALPLLQTALLELWQHRDGRRLRIDAYDRLGGVRGAVGRLAENAFGQLDAGQQVLARGVLMRLAAAGEADGVERRRLSLAQLETERSEELARAVALLVDHRLLTVSAGSIELAHEALLREWPRLRGWIEASRETIRTHHRLNAAAREWEELGRDAGALYRGARLAEAAEWASDDAHAVTDVERAFLEASNAARTLEQTQRRRRIRFALGGLSAAVVLVSAVALIAVLQSREAARQRDIAASRELAASSITQLGIDPALGLELALRALGRHDTKQAQDVLRQATYTSRVLDIWPTHRAIARSLSVSRDGKTVASGGDDGVVAVRRIDSGRLISRIASPKGSTVGGVALSPDGRRVVWTREDGVVTIAAIGGGGSRRLMDFAGETAPAYGTPNYGTTVSFSDDGRRVAVGALDGSVRVVRADGGGRVVVLHGGDGQVLDVGFDRGGARIVSASDDGLVRVWDIERDKATPLPHEGVESAAFSPDGSRIATAGDDKTVRVWQPGSGRPPLVIRVGQQMLSVRFRRDGRRLVTSGLDGIVRIFDVRGGPVLDELKGHHGVARGAVYLPGGQVVSTADDGVVRRWAPSDSAILRGSFVNVSFSPDGRRILTGGADGRARVYDRVTGARVATIGPRGARAMARYSADGTRIVIASRDGSVRVADLRSGTSRVVVAPDPQSPKTAADLDPDATRVASGGDDPTTTVQPLNGHGRTVVLKGAHHNGLSDLHFSRDGREVVTASLDGTARIWNLATARVERTLAGHGATVTTAVYSTDDRRIVTAGADGTVRIWPADGRGRTVILRGHDGSVNAAELSRDGTRVVSAGADGTIRLWDAAGGDTLAVLYQHRGAALGASFSRDGKWVVSLGESDGIARISPCEVCGSLDEVRRIARTRADRVLNPIERARFLPAEG
jgi:WD40 repeat protein/DNA-binding SARP family transcriptional activator/energy-coupling factor transporter ATP-binding protein EcfA2